MPLFARQSFCRSLPAICITRSLQTALMNSRTAREDLLALSRSNNFGSTGRLCSRSTSLKSPSATCISEGFLQHIYIQQLLFQKKRSTAIAIGSRSRIPLRLGPHLETRDPSPRSVFRPPASLVVKGFVG